MGTETNERMCRAEGVNPHNLRYCHNTGRVAGSFPLAMAEGEWMCWGSEGDWQGLPAVTLTASGKHCPPCAAFCSGSSPVPACTGRVSPALCLHKPREQSWRLFLPPGRNAASFNGLCCKARRALAGLGGRGESLDPLLALALVSQVSPQPSPTVRSCTSLLIACSSLFRALNAASDRENMGRMFCTHVRRWLRF